MNRQFFFISLILLFFASIWVMNAGEKNIKFSHRLHIKDAGMSCPDCHGTVEGSEKAEDKNLPAKDICANCHDVGDDEKCGICHVDVENPQAFAVIKRNYFFNHKKHLQYGCDKCHSGIEETEVSLGDKIPSQAHCNSCHNGISASMDCYGCHPSDTRFRPDDHNPSWSREHMVQVRAGGADCAHCHSNNFCQECHEATDLLSTRILPAHVYTAYAPTAKGEQSLVLKSVHGLNYRYLHQLDANGKEKDCGTCHESSFYCAECHNSSGLNEQIRPAWHGGPDWGALATGVGTGGGRHAELARRDIERCTACHDVQGADPACLMCHVDFDGIRQTDPKTHASGFANQFGEDGDFHNDGGAVCFNCHTNTRQAGIGFCGYCHGKNHD